MPCCPVPCCPVPCRPAVLPVPAARSWPAARSLGCVAAVRVRRAGSPGPVGSQRLALLRSLARSRAVPGSAGRLPGRSLPRLVLAALRQTGLRLAGLRLAGLRLAGLRLAGLRLAGARLITGCARSRTRPGRRTWFSRPRMIVGEEVPPGPVDRAGIGLVSLV